MGKILQRRLKQTRFVSPAHETIVSVFVTASWLRRLFDQKCALEDLTFRQYNVLRILRGAYPRAYPRSEIIERMIEPAADVTRILDRLIKDGFAIRIPSQKDRRESLAQITNKGLNALANLEQHIKDCEDQVSAVLSDEECALFARLCEKIYGKDYEDEPNVAP